MKWERGNKATADPCGRQRFNPEGTRHVRARGPVWAITGSFVVYASEESDEKGGTVAVCSFLWVCVASSYV